MSRGTRACLLAMTCCACSRKPAPPSTAEEPKPAPISIAATATEAPSAVPRDVEPAPVDGCPGEMARIGGYCIDRWEAHLFKIAADGSETMHPYYERPAPGVRYRARSRPLVFPQAYVDRIESAAACKEAGKRLCTVTEWYRACRGPKGTTWPYGNSESEGKCNTGKEHLLGKLFGPTTHWKYEEHFNNPIVDREPGFLARTGEYAECRSGTWAHDMVGNLHEWVSDRVDDSLGKKIPLIESVRQKAEKRHGNAIFLGGFFSTRNEHGDGCAFVTTGHVPTYHDYSTGFRCCRDASK